MLTTEIESVDHESFLAEIHKWKSELTDMDSPVQEIIYRTLDTVEDIFYDNCNFWRC